MELGPEPGPLLVHRLNWGGVCGSNWGMERGLDSSEGRQGLTLRQGLRIVMWWGQS